MQACINTHRNWNRPWIQFHLWNSHHVAVCVYCFRDFSGWWRISNYSLLLVKIQDLLKIHLDSSANNSVNILFITLLLVNRVIQALNYTKIAHFSMIFLTNLAYTPVNWNLWNAWNWNRALFHWNRSSQLSMFHRNSIETCVCLCTSGRVTLLNVS